MFMNQKFSEFLKIWGISRLKTCQLLKRHSAALRYLLFIAINFFFKKTDNHFDNGTLKHSEFGVSDDGTLEIVMSIKTFKSTVAQGKTNDGQASSSPLAGGIIILALIQEQLGARVQK